MSEENKSNEDGEPIRYHHSFSDEELDMMLYEWDETTFPVKEYHYMKKEWATPDAIIGGKKQEPVPKKEKKPQPDMQANAIDTGTRTVVDLNKDAPEGEVPVFLDIDTGAAAAVVEFYAPWCPHCRQFKSYYVSVAQEVSRRSIGNPVNFYAVSCQLYREVCRAYDVSGFPLVLGYGRGMDIKQRGFELNKDGVTMTAEIVGGYLNIPLAHEQKDTGKLNLTTSEQKQDFESYAKTKADEAATIKAIRQSHQSTINERFHDAATSLAYVFKSAVYVSNAKQLEDKRAIALQEFIELTDWALPQSWHVRTGLIEDVLGNMVSIVEEGPQVLINMVEKHQSVHIENGRWGDLHIKDDTSDKRGLGGDAPQRRGPPSDPDASFWKNIKYTESCHHNERGMGFTCGLWELLHILSIGASVPIHRMYGFRSGYHVAPLQVAEVMKRFIGNFFACDVCRWNFINMYERGGHGLVERLIDTMPELTDKTSEEQIEAGRELALWLWEVHNSVNVRLMKEQANAQHRNVTAPETLAAVFPPKDLCTKCWEDDTLTTYDRDEVFAFLKRWYWPRIDNSERSFQTVVRGRLTRLHQIQTKWESHWQIIGPVGIVLALILRRFFNKSADLYRKNV